MHYTDTYPNCDSYSDRNTDSNGDWDSNCYAHADNERNSYSQVFAHAEAASHAGPASVTLADPSSRKATAGPATDS
jgi:uncharacterized membrane-anchored protein